MTTFQFINRDDYLLPKSNKSQAKFLVFSNNFKLIRIGPLKPQVTNPKRINDIQLLFFGMGIINSQTIHIKDIKYIPDFQLTTVNGNTVISGLQTNNPFNIDSSKFSFTYIPKTLNYRSLNYPNISYLSDDKLISSDKYKDFWSLDNLKLILTLYVCEMTVSLQDIIIEELPVRKYHYFLSWEYNNAGFIFADVKDDKEIRQILKIMAQFIMNGQITAILTSLKNLPNLPSYISNRIDRLLKLVQFLQQNQFTDDKNFNQISSISDYLTKNKPLTIGVKEVTLKDQALSHVQNLTGNVKSKFNDLNLTLKNRFEETDVYRYYTQNPQLYDAQTQAQDEVEKFQKYIEDYQSKIKNAPDEIEKWKNLTNFIQDMNKLLSELHNEHHRHFSSKVEEQKQKVIHQENVEKIVKDIEKINNTVQFNYFEDEYFEKLKNHLIAMKPEDFNKDFKEAYSIIANKIDPNNAPVKIKNLLCHIIYLFLTYVDFKSVAIVYYINLYIFFVIYNYNYKDLKKLDKDVKKIFNNFVFGDKVLNDTNFFDPKNKTLPVKFWLKLIKLIFNEINGVKDAITHSKKSLLGLLTTNPNDNFFDIIRKGQPRNLKIDFEPRLTTYFDYFIEENNNNQDKYMFFFKFLYFINQERKEKNKEYVDQNDFMIDIVKKKVDTFDKRNDGVLEKYKYLYLYLYIGKLLKYDKIDFIFYPLYTFAFPNFEARQLKIYNSLKEKGLNEMNFLINDLN